MTDGTTSPPPPNEPIKGFLGELHTKKGSEARILVISNNEIVNNSYEASAATGCGLGGGADGAVNAALGLPSPAGTNTAIIRENSSRPELKQSGKSCSADNTVS